jgi:hypothetical protein
MSFKSLRPTSWPVVAAALLYGVVECAALWRSRAVDGLFRSPHARPRR